MGLMLTGNENERFAYVCKNQTGALMCETGTMVIWMKSVEMGVSGNYANDGKGAIICPRGGTDCNVQIDAKHTLPFPVHVVTVPNKTITCNGENAHVNYIHLTFCCIEGKWVW